MVRFGAEGDEVEVDGHAGGNGDKVEIVVIRVEKW